MNVVGFFGFLLGPAPLLTFIPLNLEINWCLTKQLGCLQEFCSTWCHCMCMRGEACMRKGQRSDWLFWINSIVLDDRLMSLIPCISLGTPVLENGVGGSFQSTFTFTKVENLLY